MTSEGFKKELGNWLAVESFQCYLHQYKNMDAKLNSLEHKIRQLRVAKTSDRKFLPIKPFWWPFLCSLNLLLSAAGPEEGLLARSVTAILVSYPENGQGLHWCISVPFFFVFSSL